MSSIWKNVYIYKLYDIVKEYIDTFHRKIKMKPIAFKDDTYIDFEIRVMIKIRNLKLVIK